MDQITVCARMRPMNEREVRNSQKSVWQCVPQHRAIQQTDDKGAPLPGSGATWSFDAVFDKDTSTEHLYKTVASDIVASVAKGINGTVFAYGQTSSGKTYTMHGTPDQPGILQLSSQHLFDIISKSEERDFLIRVSYIEIYNEVVKDLLDPQNSVNIREDVKRGVFVDAKEQVITDIKHIYKALRDGERHRHVGATDMNAQSSRSHTIFKLVIESKERCAGDTSLSDDVDGAVLVATLNLVDLAGSEGARNTSAEGQRLKEAGNINKSLLTLSRVIYSLSESASGKGGLQPPFRESKLTRILQPSLAGSIHAAMPSLPLYLNLRIGT
jgi:centromeric protein E